MDKKAEVQEKIKNTQEKLREAGYFASMDLAKKVALFENAGAKSDKKIPILLLQGEPGAGKTFLGESFAKMIGAQEAFIQCVPKMGAENFYKDIDTNTLIDKQVNGGLNLEVILKIVEYYAKQSGDPEGFYKMFDIDPNKRITAEDLRDNREVVKLGILVQALEASKNGPVVITIDELDKARPEVDSFLLDYAQNGRISTGTETYQKGDYPIYMVITSNDQRELTPAIKDRSRKVFVPRPEKELFLEILGLPQDHYLGLVYDKSPEFSIRRAQEYLTDLEFLGEDIDLDSLSQFVGDMEIDSVADLQQIMQEGIEIDLSNLEKCVIHIDSDNQADWMRAVLENKGAFDLRTGEKNEFCVIMNTIEQFTLASNYIDFEERENRYSGWVAYEMSEQEMQGENVVWATNKMEDGTRLGIKKVGENYFNIAMNRGMTLVQLNSYEGLTAENFLGQAKEEIEQEYETDSEYGKEEREERY